MKRHVGTSGREGSAIIAAVVLSAVLGVIAGAFLLMTSSEYLLTRRSYHRAAALNLAEAGAEYAILALNTGDFSGWSGSDPRTLTIASFTTASGEPVGDIRIFIDDPTGSPVVRSTGYVPGMAAPSASARTVRTQLQPVASQGGGPFTRGFFGRDRVRLTGSGVLDSYDSRNGAYGGLNTADNCDVGTNGTLISWSGSGDVHGDMLVFGNDAGRIDLSGSGTVRGDIVTRGDDGRITMSGSGTIVGDVVSTGTTSSRIDISGSRVIEGSLITAGTSSGAISLSGSTQVQGNAATGPGGTVDLSGSSEIQGAVSHSQEAQGEGAPEFQPALDLPEVVVPSSLVGSDYPAWQSDGLVTLTGSSSRSIPAGAWKLRRIRLTGSTGLTIGEPGETTTVYLTGYMGKSIDQSGSSTITIQGSVVFYVDAEVSSSGSGLWNPNGNPPDCLIWGTPGCTSVKLSGSRNLFGAVYAPNAEIKVSGSGHTFGSFVGREIEHNGSLGFHYDEALGAIGGGGGGTAGYAVVSWQEKE
ncbi:MAG: hypothetical protein PHN82_06830 [bacterium]|nr:hypothetical protein [bacterium]